MDTVSLPLSQVPKSSKLLVDYVERHDQVARYYNGSPFSAETYDNLRRQLHNIQMNRKPLVEVLLKQNKAFGAGQETLRNVQRLSHPETLAVVTGQQVGLLSGPAFTLYKALTAIRLSQSLNARGMTTVTVFWLASEDHDLEEVAQTYALNDDYDAVHLHDPGERPAPQSAVGRVKLTESISGV